jgi:hypothetical protein
VRISPPANRLANRIGAPPRRLSKPSDYVPVQLPPADRDSHAGREDAVTGYRLRKTRGLLDEVREFERE